MAREWISWFGSRFMSSAGRRAVPDAAVTTAVQATIDAAIADITDWVKRSGGTRDAFEFVHDLQTSGTRTRPQIMQTVARQLALEPTYFVDEVASRVPSSREVLAANPVPAEVNEQLTGDTRRRVLSRAFASGTGGRVPDDRTWTPPTPRGTRRIHCGHLALPSTRSDLTCRSRLDSPRGVDLVEGMNKWLEFLEAATSIEAKYRGRIGYEIVVTQPDLPKAVDLTRVGVGVSQVVPVLLLCLLSRPGSVLLFWNSPNCISILPCSRGLAISSSRWRDPAGTHRRNA